MAPVNQGAIEKVYHCIEPSQAPANEQARAVARARAGSPEVGAGHYLDTRAYSVDKGELFKRLGRLGKGHARALQMAGFIGQQEEKHHHKAEKLRSCGAWLIMRELLRTGRFKLQQGMFCHQHTLCPLCAQLRAGKLVGKYAELVQKVIGTRKLSVLTFTVKSGEDLVERLKHLQKNVGKLMSKARRARSGGRDKTEFSKFVGGVISYEVKRGKGSGLWHPHGHALCLQEEKVDIAELRDEWHRETKDSVNVDLRLVKGDPIKAFLEVFKYAMKFGDMTLEDNWLAARCLARKKLLRSWGSLRGVKMPDKLTDDDCAGDGKYIDRFFRYVHAMQSYAESTNPRR
jgi:hypothetical protein